MPFVGDFTPVGQGELRSFSIDFSLQLATGETISSATAVVSAFQGVDPNAANLAYGGPTITGNIVSQFVGQNGTNTFLQGVVYRLTMTVLTSAGQTLLNWAHLPCLSIV